MIRPAREADRAAIADLHAESWHDAYAGLLPPPMRGRAALDAHLGALWSDRPIAWPLLTLLHEDEGGQAGLLGFVCCLADRAPPFVDNLHVRPSARGQGIGRSLLRALGARLGGGPAELTVLAENRPARAFYRRVGGVEGPATDHVFLGAPTMIHHVRFDLRRL